MVHKRALGAFPFLSQIAVTSGRMSRQNHSVTRGEIFIFFFKTKEKGDGGVTPQLEEVAGKRKQKAMGWQQYGM